MYGTENRRALTALDDPERYDFLDELSGDERDLLEGYWPLWARTEQMPPKGNWRLWLICAGRGFGKTRAGAEWVRHIAEEDPHARIALVTRSIAEARAVMVEGESGIIACHQYPDGPDFEPSLRRLTWPNGAQATLYSASEPESLRGPQQWLCIDAQAQKEFTVNEAFALIDALLHPVVEGETDNPPASPTEGECWIVGSQPTAEWFGNAGRIACRQSGNWLFVSPPEGLVAFDKSAGRIARYDGAWLLAAAINMPSGGATVDAEARAAIGEIVDAMTAAGILEAK